MTNCLVAPFVPPWYADSDVVLPPLVSFGHHPPSGDHILPIGVKGVQILPGDGTRGARSSDEAPIKNALYQVRYAATALQFGFPALPRNHFEEWVLSDNFNFVLPLMVTTAELYVLKREAGISEISEARDAADVADKVPALIVEKDPGEQLRYFSHLLLRQNYDQLLRSRVTAEPALAWTDRMFRRPADNQSSLADLQSLDVPRRVVVVSFEFLATFLASWRDLFSNDGALQTYDQAEVFVGNIVFDMAKRRERFAAQRNAAK